MENLKSNDATLFTTEWPSAVNNTVFTVHLGKLL